MCNFIYFRNYSFTNLVNKFNPQTMEISVHLPSASDIKMSA